MSAALWAIALIVFSLGASIKAQHSSNCDDLLSWACENGKCIDFNDRCNGKVDCSDGSDETVTECISFQCRENEFRCGYGACVETSAECNGVKDCADNSDELTRECLPNIDDTLRVNCSIDMFQCRSGECIPLDNFCDGHVECSDRSDESVEYCTSKCCPPFGFRCGYGGCIDERRRCDRNYDCADESDENYLLCGYPKGERVRPTTTTTSTPKPTSGECRVTRLPKNGWIENVVPPNEKLSVGDFVAPLTQVSYKCLDNHLIKGSTVDLCFNGEWRGEVPDCQPFCSTKAITGVSIVATNCSLKDVEVRCSDPAEPSTIARINCRDRYERDVGDKQQVISCGDDGVWSPLPKLCRPICGDESSYAAGDRSGNTTQVPWRVALHKQDKDGYHFHCGGTIINARVVISAMYCFWDSSQNKTFDVNLFRVVVGDVNAKEDSATQHFDIERIYYDPSYKPGNSAATTVMVILKSTIDFKSNITPTCIPYGLTFEERVVPSEWQ